MAHSTSTDNEALVLLVDPDPETLACLQQGFDGPCLSVVQAGSLAEALLLLESRRPRLILSELALPDGSGFALCRRIREHAELADRPIVLVSRWCHEADRILAFECGADDFVAKPFFARELASRTRALLRRSSGRARREAPDHEPGSGIPLVLHSDRLEITVADQKVTLTPREHALLGAMLRRRGRVLSRSELIDDVWGDEATPSDRSVDAHVKSLRRKLGRARDVVETVRGLGYRLSERSVVTESERDATPGAGSRRI